MVEGEGRLSAWCSTSIGFWRRGLNRSAGSGANRLMVPDARAKRRHGEQFDSQPWSLCELQSRKPVAPETRFLTAPVDQTSLGGRIPEPCHRLELFGNGLDLPTRKQI